LDFATHAGSSMKWRDFAPIQVVIQDALPEGVYLYTTCQISTETINVRIIDWDETTSYFEKYYDISELSQTQVITAILTDVQKFKEYWNSPLMKALR
jgi:hypothetical protein